VVIRDISFNVLCIKEKCVMSGEKNVSSSSSKNDCMLMRVMLKRERQIDNSQNIVRSLRTCLE
jgi:hypothetical protein